MSISFISFTSFLSPLLSLSLPLPPLSLSLHPFSHISSFLTPTSLSYNISNGNYLPNPGSAFRPIEPADGGSALLKSPSYSGSLADVIQEVTRQLHKFDLSYDVW